MDNNCNSCASIGCTVGVATTTAQGQGAERKVLGMHGAGMVGSGGSSGESVHRHIKELMTGLREREKAFRT